MNSINQAVARPRRSKWPSSLSLSASIALSALLVLGCNNTDEPANDSATHVSQADWTAFEYRGQVVKASTVRTEQVEQWKSQGWNAVAIELEDDADHDQVVAAAQRIKDGGLQLGYYIEVARCPTLAESQPQLMASLQGHDEWRRLYPDFPQISPDQVVKVWPWAPIVYREAYDAQLQRIERLLADLPPADRIWLHDLQGGPSCCGCGHPLCRWTGDYGPIHTAEPLGDDAAALFVMDIQERFPDSKIVPVWATECEAEDQHEMCGGVGCYEGICWKAWNKQLAPLAETTELLGVSCYYKEYQRDLPRYERPAGWVRFAIKSFDTMTRKHDAEILMPNRLIAVLQGWNVSEEEIAAQISEAKAAEARGILLVTPVQDQSWLPKIHDVDRPASIQSQQ